MTALHDRARNALEETELGSALLAGEATLDAAAHRIAQLIRDENAHAVMSIAWQLPPTLLHVAGRQEIKSYLLQLSERIKEGEVWDR